MDGGGALGTRFQKFKEQYFVPVDYHGYKWELRPGAATEIAKRLQGLVYVADSDAYEAALPAIETEIIGVPWPLAAKDIDRALLKDGVWGDVEAVNAAVAAGKRQQVAAGGLYAGDERELVWSLPFKRDALLEAVRRAGEPVIVVYNYAFERDMLKAMYPDAPNIGSGKVVSTDIIAAFNRGKVPVLLLHWRSGAHGLNLQGACRTMIHTSPLWAADGWKQTIGRIRRRGQKQDCRRWVLVSEGSIEEEMFMRVGQKAADESVFMQALKAAA